MNSTLSPATAILLRPTVALAEVVAAFRDALGALRHVEEVVSRPPPAAEALAGLSEHVLKDIGAPEPLIANAVARRQSSLGHELLWPSYSRFE